MANINTMNVLTQIMQMSEEERNALRVLLGVSATPTLTPAPAPTQVSAPIAQTAPQSAPVAHKAGSKDTVIEVAVAPDGKHIELWNVTKGKRENPFVFMAAVREQLNDVVIGKIDKTLPSVEVYHDDRGHAYGSHKMGVYPISLKCTDKAGNETLKAFTQKALADWVAKVNPVVLTAESKDAYKAAKADKDAKKLANKISALERAGYTVTKG